MSTAMKPALSYTFRQPRTERARGELVTGRYERWIRQFVCIRNTTRSGGFDNTTNRADPIVSKSGPGLTEGQL